jgi:cardiolipin synthase
MGEMIKKAKESVRIVQPYVQNVASIEDILKDALARGVKVEVVTARYRDQPCYMGLLNSDIFGDLIDKGAVVKEEPFSFLHMKVCEIDNGREITIGSMNQDHWSYETNNEANVHIANVEGAKAEDYMKQKSYQSYLKVYNRLWRECRYVDRDEQYTTGGWFNNELWRYFFKGLMFIAKDRTGNAGKISRD